MFRRRMSMISEMIQQFNAHFDTAHTPRIFFAPCQFNIMGGNADYNKGKALPFALSFGMYAIVHKREDTIIRLHSADHPDKPITCDIRELAYHPKDHWANHSDRTPLTLQEYFLLLVNLILWVEMLIIIKEKHYLLRYLLACMQSFINGRTP